MSGLNNPSLDSSWSLYWATDNTT